MPQISVIVPIYNVEKYLNRCVDSILAQTFTNFELILVDDGSPDNCGKICDEYARKDSRVHVIHKENGGLSDARNAGIDWAFENSDSEWLTFIDSDDWVHPKYLEALYNAIIETDCNISVCGFEKTNGENPTVDENCLKATTVNSEDFYCKHNINAVVAWGKLYKKYLFKNIRYPVGKIHEDEFTTYKLLFQNESCMFINQPLYCYFHNSNSLTKSPWTPKRLDSMEAFYNQLEFFKSRGFKRAYLKVINIIAYIMVQYIKQINKDSGNFKYKRTLQKKLQKHLKTYKQDASFSIHSSPEYYECAYPTFMKYYWIITAQLNKLKRNGHNNV